METEEGGGSGEAGEKVEIGKSAAEEDGVSGLASSGWKSGAVESIGSEGVSEGVHG